MNRYQKGKYLENLAVKKLEADGWTIAFRSVFVRFHPIDFAGLFDIVAYKEKVWRFVQVKSRKDKKTLKKISDFQNTNAPMYSRCEMWVWNSKKRDFDISFHNKNKRCKYGRKK